MFTRRKPDVDIMRVPDVGLFGKDDPTVLEWAAQQGRVVLSQDVSTLTKHGYHRVAAGLDMAGMFEVPTTLSIRRAVEDLLLIVECSLEDEWEGQVRYLPLWCRWRPQTRIDPAVDGSVNLQQS